jgi:GMP synthase-like glutamine amidotransferase
MILFIITDTAEAARRGSTFHDAKVTLEGVSGDLCLMAHYSRVSLEMLRQVRPWAVCHSGCGAEFKTYDVLEHKGYNAVIRQWEGPQIGLCGGHQIIAHAFGGTVGHMGRLKTGEADHNPSYHAGLYKEWGAYPVRIVRPDPLFAGLGKGIMVLQSHMDEVKRLPRCLTLLAGSARCRVQAFVHMDKPVYGVQFHPERFSKDYPDGGKVLENFFRLARQTGAAAGGE